MRKILFGHRGAAGEAPENTLDGFAHARQIGVRAIELDVRLSVDEELVVIHDATVDRTTNAKGAVSDFQAAQLRRLDARGSCPTWQRPVGVPLLSEVLQAYCDLDAFQLEIKKDVPARLETLADRLIAQVERFQIAERVVVTSFDPAALAIVRRLAPLVRRGFISAYDQRADLDTALQLDCWNACTPLSTSSKPMVQAAQANGLHVTGWLGNTVADLEKLLNWDVDSITSDFPSAAIRFLRGRELLA